MFLMKNDWLSAELKITKKSRKYVGVYLQNPTAKFRINEYIGSGPGRVGPQT